MSELPANVGTSDGRNSRRSSGLPTSTVNQTASTAEAGTPGSGQVSVGTPGERRDFRWTELPANVGTSDVHRQRAVRSTGAGTPGKGRDFRLSGVPTYVGTSDTTSHRKNILCAREVLECPNFYLIIVLEHSIFLRPTKLASLFIVRRILNSKTKFKTFGDRFEFVRLYNFKN